MSFHGSPSPGSLVVMRGDRFLARHTNDSVKDGPTQSVH